MQLIIQNTREPEDRLLDLKAQIATNELGSDRSWRWSNGWAVTPSTVRSTTCSSTPRGASNRASRN